jgi:deazaflavin-dependent oxidoreductase (nitroreductase family)
MSQTDLVLPDWIADHLQRYIASNGADGHIWRGVPTLLLTTKGRKSGAPRTLPLIYGKDGKDGKRYVIIASRGGTPDHPGWYKNLLANPTVDLQVAADRFQARASTVSGPDRERLWQLMAKIWPDYDAYQKKTAREIPVVVLERI